MSYHFDFVMDRCYYLKGSRVSVIKIYLFPWYKRITIFVITLDNNRAGIFSADFKNENYELDKKII